MSKSEEYKVTLHLTEDEYKNFMKDEFVQQSNGCCGVYSYHEILEDVWKQITPQMKEQQSKINNERRSWDTPSTPITPCDRSMTSKVLK